MEIQSPTKYNINVEKNKNKLCNIIRKIINYDIIINIKIYDKLAEKSRLINDFPPYFASIFIVIYSYNMIVFLIYIFIIFGRFDNRN